jgi:hypothetical protein
VRLLTDVVTAIEANLDTLRPDFIQASGTELLETGRIDAGKRVALTMSSPGGGG